MVTSSQATARWALMLLSLAIAGAGCGRSEPKKESPSDSGAAPGPPIVRVQGALVDSGQITTAVATRRAFMSPRSRPRAPLGAPG